LRGCRRKSWTGRAGSAPPAAPQRPPPTCAFVGVQGSLRPPFLVYTAPSQRLAAAAGLVHTRAHLLRVRPGPVHNLPKKLEQPRALLYACGCLLAMLSSLHAPSHAWPKRRCDSSSGASAVLVSFLYLVFLTCAVTCAAEEGARRGVQRGAHLRDRQHVPHRGGPRQRHHARGGRRRRHLQGRAAHLQVRASLCPNDRLFRSSEQCI